MKKSQQKLFNAMVPGRVYRRQELALYSPSLSRDLAGLLSEKKVTKAAAGLYYRPKMTSVGPAPASSEELVRAFLNDDDFLFTSFNEYNLLGLGLTQLYNKQLVYNRKRYGDFVLDGRRFTFRRPRNFPKQLSKEFLFVDLLNNRDELSGDKNEIEKLVELNCTQLKKDDLDLAAKHYGKVATRKFFKRALAA